MLVIHPTSTCDVCLEAYNFNPDEPSNGPNLCVPHAIACGHVFCLRCLQSLTHRRCPLCRSSFMVDGVRKLHIDQASQAAVGTPRPSAFLTDLSASDTDADKDGGANPQATKLQDAITRLVLDGNSTSARVRELLEQTHGWLRDEPEDQHADLRASFLLLYRYTELHTKSQADRHALGEVERTNGELRRAFGDVERQYEELMRSKADERETARAVEKSLREHFERVDAEWRGKYEGAVAECKRLRDELYSVRYSKNPLPAPPRPCVDPRFFYPDTPEPGPSAHLGGSNSKLARKLKDADGGYECPPPISASSSGSGALLVHPPMVIGEHDTFHISPLPLPGAPLPVPDDHGRAQRSRSGSGSGSSLSNALQMHTIPSIELDVRPVIPEMPTISYLKDSHTLAMKDVSAPRSLPRSFETFGSRYRERVSESSCGGSGPGLKSTMHHSFYQPRPDLRRSSSGKIKEDEEMTCGSGSMHTLRSRGISGEEMDDMMSELRDKWRSQLHELLESPTTSTLPTTSSVGGGRPNHIHILSPPALSIPPPLRSSGANVPPSPSRLSYFYSPTENTTPMEHFSGTGDTADDRMDRRTSPNPLSLHDSTNHSDSHRRHRSRSKSTSMRSSVRGVWVGQEYDQ